jgi:DNA-binding transcriptional ArsR family regulator
MIDIAASKDLEDPREVLAVLADPTRRRIVELLGETPRTASEIYRAFPIADPAVSRHLRVLREAGLIVERRVPADKRVRLYTLAPQPLEILSAWIEGVSRAWQQQLDSFRDYVDVRSGGGRRVP